MIDYEVLNPLLSSQAAVTALVGTGIYPMEVPQGAVLPAVTYSIVGMRESPTFETSGMNRYRVEFRCWGVTYMSASAVRSAIVAALNGFSGTVAGVVIQAINVLQPRDNFDHESLQYWLTVEFYITCNS